MKPCTQCGGPRTTPQRSWCKRCQSANDKKRRQEGGEAFLRRERESCKRYRQTPRGRLARDAARKAWRERNRDKECAHSALSRAVRAGTVVLVGVCEWCTSTVGIECHHEDYSKPLEFNELCKPCHTKADQARLARLAGGESDG